MARDKYTSKDFGKIEFDDDARSSSAVGIKELALKQFQRCQELGSKELTFGGQKTIVIDGRAQTVMRPNTAQAFVNSVEMLKITLQDEINKNMKFMKSHMNEVEKKRESNMYQYKEKKKFLVEECRIKKKNPNPYLSRLRNQKDENDVQISMLLFQKMSILLGRINWLSEEQMDF